MRVQEGAQKPKLVSIYEFLTEQFLNLTKNSPIWHKKAQNNFKLRSTLIVRTEGNMENKFYYYGKKATDIVGSESHGITIVCCPPPAPLSPLSPPPPYPPLSSLPAPPNSNHTIIPHHPRKCTTHLKSNFFIIKSLSLFFLRFSKKI